MPYWMDDVYACCSYEGVMKECIHLLKYKGREYMARPLGGIMADCLESGVDINNIDVFVPVPLHKKKKVERGFNQSELLIRQSLIKYEKELSADNLIRIQNTRSQVNLYREERAMNVEGAFRVKNPELFSGKNVLLVDDVCTTGATLNECAKSLKNAGVKKVFGIVLANK